MSSSTTLASVKETIAFVGGGNMAAAIIGGLLASGFPPSQLVVSEPFRPRSEYMRTTFPSIIHTSNNSAAVKGGLPIPNSSRTANPADVVLLAVKPNMMRKVAEGLSKEVGDNRAVVVSIAAGIRTCDISRWLSFKSGLGYEPAVVRCMPNTPALVQEGATGLFATHTVSESQRAITVTLLDAVSETIWVEEEDLLNAVTGISGSGPAYFFLILEALEEAGVKAGLTREVAGKLAVKTCFGAAKMAGESPDSFAELRKKVTSPNGTTAAAIDALMKGGIKPLIGSAVNAAKDRGRDMGLEFAKL